MIVLSTFVSMFLRKYATFFLPKSMNPNERKLQILYHAFVECSNCGEEQLVFSN